MSSVKPDPGVPSAGGDSSESKDQHINLKVRSNDAEVFFKIKRSTPFTKLMNAYCERQGQSLNACRFTFEGNRLDPTSTPEKLDMEDGDTIEVFLEQVGGMSC